VLAFPGIFEAEACLKTQLDAINDIGLLQDATIVITPNGVNENILHTVKGNTITAPPYNLSQYTETTTLWQGGQAVLSIDTTQLNPFGVMSSVFLREAANTNVHVASNNIGATIVLGKIYTFSVYFKKGTGATAPDIIQLTAVAGIAGIYANFNITTGIVTLTSGCTATIVSAPNGWWRCSITATATATSTVSGLRIYFCNNNPLSLFAPSYLGATTSNIFFIGTQIEESPVMTTYQPVIFTQILEQGYAQHTRSTTGHRVESTGLVREVPQANLIPFSQALNSWSNVNLAVGVNALIAPDGTMTADSSTRTGVSHRHQIAVSSYYTLTPIDNYVFSVYVKQGVGTATSIGLSNTSAQTINASFNISLGTINSVTGCTATISSEANGYYRCAIYFTSIAMNNAMMFHNGGIGLLGCYFWGMQVTRGTVLQPYYPTVNRANTPRIDYTDGSCPTLLLEGAVINNFLRSEQFDDASWIKSNITVLTNTEVAPNGLVDADTLTATANDADIAQPAISSSTNSSPRIFSVYLKRKTGGGLISLEMGRTIFNCTINSLTWTRCWALDTGLTSTVSATSGTYTVTTSSPHNLVTGDRLRWVRLTTTTGTLVASYNGAITVTSPTTYTFVSGILTGTGTSTHYVNTGRIRFATSGDEVYAWGAQLEVTPPFLQNGYYEPTSYIPTTAATVTRAQDFLSLYKIRENNLLNNTWSVFCDVKKIGGNANDAIIGISDSISATPTNGIIVSGVPLFVTKRDAGVTTLIVATTVYQPQATAYFKILITCNNGIVETWIDGSKLSTTTLVNYQLLSLLEIIANNGISRYKQIVGWNRVLNRSEIDLLFAYPYYNAGYTPTNNELQQIINRAYAEGFTLPNATLLGHCDTLITEMKNDGVWNVSDVYYNFAYNDVTLSDWARINWMNPYGGLGIATLFGGVTYQTNGFKGDGVNGYVDVRFNAQAQAINYQLNNAGRMAVISNIGSGSGNSIDSSTNGERIRLSPSSNQRINSGTGNLNIGITFSGLGLKSIMRDSVTNIRLQDTTILYTRTATSTVLPQNKTLLGSANLDSMFDGAISAYWIGASINDTQINNFRTYYNTYLTNIGLTAFA
jgi:hypothetical protein